jgi:hypothetical protein
MSSMPTASALSEEAQSWREASSGWLRRLANELFPCVWCIEL